MIEKLLYCLAIKKKSKHDYKPTILGHEQETKPKNPCGIRRSELYTKGT
jgi:hypothetical protein